MRPARGLRPRHRTNDEGSCGCLFLWARLVGHHRPVLNSPNPALVTRRGARRLPRLPLLLLCAAYVLPGVLDRDPWRNADLLAFGRMLSIAEGRSSWWQPLLGGVAGDVAPLPHALGALFIVALTPLGVPADVAARLPFAALLALTLALVWYTCWHLARTEAAQPVAFAFGGEADPVDYARAIADGALLALIASLGLLQLGHETTPELVQLFAVALWAWALAAAPWRSLRARLAAVLALPVLAASGAPAIAVAIGAGGSIVCWRSRSAEVRRFAIWAVIATLAAAALAGAVDAWRWRVAPLSSADLASIARQWLWFLWPGWLLALWTLWRWRRQLTHRHLAVPMVGVGAAAVANIAMGGSDRALMLALPGLAVLAAFALPTLKRSASAAVDWFSMFFFSGAAIAAWVVWLSVHTGVPAKPAQNLARIAPGFVPRFEVPELVVALLGTLAWLALVRWRTGRHREAVWKSMVLPAGGVALCWLLLMTLWLPMLDHTRSARPLVDRLAVLVPREACIAAPTLSPVQVAALEVFGGWRVDARSQSASDGCEVLLRTVRAGVPAPWLPGWQFVASAQGPRDREEAMAVYRRALDPRPAQAGVVKGAGSAASAR